MTINITSVTFIFLPHDHFIVITVNVSSITSHMSMLDRVVILVNEWYQHCYRIITSILLWNLLLWSSFVFQSACPRPASTPGFSGFMPVLGGPLAVGSRCVQILKATSPESA